MTQFRAGILAEISLFPNDIQTNAVRNSDDLPNPGCTNSGSPRINFSGVGGSFPDSDEFR
jgi:hypothetical protein